MSLKKAFLLAKIEYIKWITDARMVMIAVLLIFIYTFAVKPLLTNAELMGEPLNVLEPFIAVANSGTILLILPLSFMTLISDFPRIDTNTVFYIYRVGRKNWLLGQIMKLILMSVSFLAVIFLGAVIPTFSHGFWHDGWSNVVTKFAVVFPEKSRNTGAQLLPENLYNQLSVFEATALSYLFVFAYFMMIGLILLAFSLVKRKTTGFVFCGGIISLGTALCSIRSGLMWIMPMAHSVIWLHYTKYYREPVVPIWYSVVYYCVFIAALILFCWIAMRKFSYDNMTNAAV